MILRNQTNEPLFFALPHDDVCERVGLCGCVKLPKGRLEPQSLVLRERCSVEVPACVLDLPDIREALAMKQVCVRGEA